jgi:hypothetical protein
MDRTIVEVILLEAIGRRRRLEPAFFARDAVPQLVDGGSLGDRRRNGKPHRRDHVEEVTRNAIHTLQNSHPSAGVTLVASHCPSSARGSVPAFDKD